ncbi:Putative F-box protein At1g32420 [Linum grandiflorum]
MVDGSNKGRRRRGDFSLKPQVSRSKAAYEKRKEEQKKKKKMTMTTNKIDFHDDLVATEILSRLPAKSLMRFKSVCKPWKSIIEQDSNFINLHHTRSQACPPRLLTIVLNGKQGKTSESFDFLFADMDCGEDHVRGASIQNEWSVRLPSQYTQIKGPVRGLFCFVDKSEVLIYNFSTREIVTPWIRSKISGSREWEKPVCQFGFDPDTGEHKVIFVWHASRAAPSTCFEVLTVGVDASWRTIDAGNVIPPQFLFVKSSYVNGSIYWMSHNKIGQPVADDEFLVAFDIGPEKFRTIRIPEFTLSGFSLSRSHYVTELDGCPTVVRTQATPTLKLWKFHDRNKERSNGSEREDWSEVSFEKPSYLSPWIGVMFHPIPGNDQMMIVETYDRRNIYKKEVLLMNVKLNRFYSYNRVNKTFSKFEIQGIPSLSDHTKTRCEVLVEEDLFPAAVEKPSELRLGRVSRGFAEQVGRL